jgi:hypothetical protein
MEGYRKLPLSFLFRIGECGLPTFKTIRNVFIWNTNNRRVLYYNILIRRFDNLIYQCIIVTWLQYLKSLVISCLIFGDVLVLYTYWFSRSLYCFKYIIMGSKESQFYCIIQLNLNHVKKKKNTHLRIFLSVTNAHNIDSCIRRMTDKIENNLFSVQLWSGLRKTYRFITRKQEKKNRKYKKYIFGTNWFCHI